MKRQRMIGLILFLMGTVLLLSACSPPAGSVTPPPGPGTADLYLHARQVRYRRAGGTVQELSPSPKQVLGLNDAVTVNGTGKARLLFGDYLEVMIYRDSDLVITGAPDPNAPTAYRMRLEGGSVYNTLNAQQEAERRVQIDTEWATIRAVGTGFFVHYDRMREMTWVVVKRGAVAVEAGGVEVIVRADQQTWVNPGEPPVDPLVACRTLVGEQGDLFPQVKELTGGAITDEDLLPCEIEPTAVPTPTRTSTPVPTGTRTPTPTGTRTPTPTWTPAPTGTRTPTPTPTSAPTSTPTHTPTVTPTSTPALPPADVRLISGLQLSNLCPLVGERVNATFKVRNYGGQTFTARYFGVKGRGPNSSNQDFRWIENIPLAPGAEYTYSRGRSFSIPGEYRFTPNYSPYGTNWIDITWPDGRTSYVFITVCTPTVTPTSTPTPCPELTDAYLNAWVYTDYRVGWGATGGCPPFSGTLTAQYADESEPYFTHTLTAQSGTLTDKPPLRCEGTFEIVYTLNLRDQSGQSVTATTTIYINWIC